MAYIYCITNKINNKKYIGKTNFSLIKRFREHINDAFSKSRRTENRPLYTAIRKYGVCNFSISIVCECCEEDADSLEIFYIKKYNTYNNGYNATLGGEGASKLNHKQIVYLYKQGNTSKLISLILSCDESTINKVLKSKNIKRRRKLSKGSKAVKLLDSNTDEVLNLFNSITEAAFYICETYNKNFSNGVALKIANCAKGITHSAYGYKWKF